MPTLSLGVIEVPYATPSHTDPRSAKAAIGRAKRGQAAAPKHAGSETTTGDVAEILEAKYHIFERFWEMHEADISEAIIDNLGGALANLMMGAPAQSNSLAEAMGTIETKFKQFLSNRELDGRIDGVPTLAAQEGVSHRFKNPYAPRPPRPSFIDTGLYQANFKAWVE